MWMERMVLRLVQDGALRQVQNGVLLFARDAAPREQASHHSGFGFSSSSPGSSLSFFRKILEHVQTFFAFPGWIAEAGFYHSQALPDYQPAYRARERYRLHPSLPG